MYNKHKQFYLFVFINFRYRKFNLFREYGFNHTHPSELCTFDTDFGVRFGMFICFDILFEDPAVRLIRESGVKDIIFSTAWFSEIPLLAGKLIKHFYTANIFNIVQCLCQNARYYRPFLVNIHCVYHDFD